MSERSHTHVQFLDAKTERVCACVCLDFRASEIVESTHTHTHKTDEHDDEQLVGWTNTHTPDTDDTHSQTFVTYSVHIG